MSKIEGVRSKKQRQRDARDRQRNCRAKRKREGRAVEARFYGTTDQIAEIKQCWLRITQSQRRPDAEIEPALSVVADPDGARTVTVMSEALDEAVLSQVSDLGSASSGDTEEATERSEVILADVREDTNEGPAGRAVEAPPPAFKKAEPTHVQWAKDFFGGHCST